MLELARQVEPPQTRLGADFSSDRYTIERRLGEGSFGIVYEARDRLLDRPIALKVLRAASAEALYRFKREYRQMRTLSHPGLARLYSLYESEHSWALTMELIRGEPVLRFLAKSPQSLRGAFSQLAAALFALHTAGCVHRDIKPDNVLVEYGGRVVLVDFGLTSDADGESTVRCGTPQYAAPEQWTSGVATPASDWYAFGILLYEAVCGRRPFEGSTEHLFEQKCRGLSGLEPTQLEVGHADLAELAMALLSPEPDQRPSGADVLECFQADIPAVAEAQEPFVGRAVELQQLEAGLERRQGIIWIEGQSGIGKTALVEHWLSTLGGGALVLRGFCYDTESIRFKALDGVFDDLANYLRRLQEPIAARITPRDPSAAADLFPVLRRVKSFSRDSSSELDREFRFARGVEALRDLLQGVGGYTSLVIFIDDLHAIDSDGARLLQLICAGQDSPRMLVVATVRSDLAGNVQELKAELERRCAAFSTMTLRALAPSACSELASRLLVGRNLPQTGEAAIVRESLGVPGFVRELVDSIEAHAPVAPSLDRALQRRISRCSPPAQRLLQGLALFGAPIAERICLDLARDPRALDEVVDSSLVRSTAGSPRGLGIRHDRIALAVVSGMPTQLCRELHGELAVLLSCHAPESVGEIARHYRLSGNRAAALRCSRDAAHAAEDNLAFLRAAECYGVAVECTDEPQVRSELLERRGHAFQLAGQPGLASRAFLDSARLSGSVALRIHAAGQMMLNGELGRGFAALHPILDDVGIQLPERGAAGIAQAINIGAELAAKGYDFTPKTPAELDHRDVRRVEVLMTLAWSLPFHDVLALPISALAFKHALDLGDVSLIQAAAGLYVHNHSPVLTLLPGVATAPLELCRRLSPLLGQKATPWLRMAEAAVHLFRAEHAQALAHFEWVGECAEFRHRDSSRAASLMTRAAHLTDLRDVLDKLPRWSRDAELRGAYFLQGTIALFSTPFWLAADRVQAARQSVARARAHDVESDVVQVITALQELKVEIYTGGDIDSTRRRVDALVQNSPVMSSTYIAGVYRALCAAALLVGPEPNVDQVAYELDALAALPPTSGPRSIGLSAALHAHGAGPKAAERAWRDAIAQLEEIDSPVYLAHARFQLDRVRFGARAEGRQAHRDLLELGVANPRSHARLLLGVGD